MKDLTYVSPADLQTLEQYAIALVMSMATLRTLEQFHIRAYKLGLYAGDEQEVSKTICWELRRLMGLYKQQFQHVISRCDLTEEEIVASLTTLTGKNNGT